MAKYHVVCEEFQNDCFGSFSSIIGFNPRYFVVELDPPINENTLYDIINKDLKHKTGRVMSWSKIEE